MASLTALSAQHARACRVAFLLVLLAGAAFAPLAWAAPGDTELVSVNPASGAPSGEAMFAETGPIDAVSAGGRYVVFAATPKSMGDGGVDYATAIYLRDRQDQTTTVVSRDASGATRLGWAPAISGNGRYVVYASGDALVASDTNGTVDVYVFDAQTQRNERVSVTSGEAQRTCAQQWDTGYADISPDGRYVSFNSCANLTARAEDNDGYAHVFLRDRAKGTTELVFAEAVGEGYLQWGRRTSVSDDGRFVFWYYLLRDRQLRTTTYVPLYSDKASGASYIQNETMSGNGRFIVWTGWDDVEPGDTNGWQDIWLRDLRTGTVERVSVDRAGRQYRGPAEYPHISADGRYVAFTVSATYDAAWRPPVPGGWEGVYVRDRQAGTLEYASVDNDGGPAFGVQHPSISPDGMYVAFRTEAPLGDPGALYADRTDDIYVHERGLIRTPKYDVLAPAKLDFGERVLGTSVTRRVFLQNRTPSFLVVRDFTILGTDRQSFAEDDTSGWYLMWPNDTVTVRVTFKATSFGSKSAELRLPVDTNIVRRVQLTGKVTAP